MITEKRNSCSPWFCRISKKAIGYPPPRNAAVQRRRSRQHRSLSNSESRKFTAQIGIGHQRHFPGLLADVRCALACARLPALGSAHQPFIRFSSLSSERDGGKLVSSL